MREIRFRALGQTTNKWYYGLISMITEFVCNIVSDYEHTWICDAKTLSQYTGLKDKNGTEIYEGDIVRSPQGAIQRVYYSNQFAAFLCADIYRPDGEIGDTWIVEKEDEIIGNIYENPELLEGRE